MRTLLCATIATITLALAAPAFPQALDMGAMMGAIGSKRKTQDEADAEKQRNSDYQDAMKKLPDQGASTKRDPWGTMRSSPQGDPKSTQKTTQKSNQKSTTHATTQ
jgi:hypothetical protein